MEEVQRELGLERVVKLASNEGPYGPFPSAREAIARATLELNRYPDGGAWRLRNALAERHGVAFDQVTVCAGADAVVGYACLATLDPGDEAVTAWPSFASYVIDPLKLGAVPVRVPLVDERIDLDALLAAITPRTKLVFIAAPNNPTGTTNTRAELDSYFERVPPHVLTVLDQAYFEYLDEPDYPEGVAEYLAAGHRVLVLRTFSKIFGLAGQRVGYGVGPCRRHHRYRQGASRIRRDVGRAGGGPRQPRRHGRDRAAPLGEQGVDGAARGRAPRAPASSLPDRPSRTSCSSAWVTPTRSTTPFSGEA